MYNIEQIAATNPKSSIWVSAAAGTGKTKVLIDRVLRLMLEGANVMKILCLTFTNAAATEMSQRIYKTAEIWQSNTDSIESILGRAPSEIELVRAKAIFSQIIDLPDSMPIYTIHAFCAKLLRLFSFEAGIVANFRIISESDIENIVDILIEEILLKYPDIIGFFLENMHEYTFREILSEIISAQNKFEDIFMHFNYDTYQSSLQKQYNITNNLESLNDELRIELQDLPEDILSALDINYSNPFTDIISKFLTQKGEIRKTILPKTKARNYSNKLNEIAELVYLIKEQENIFAMLDSTMKMFNLAEVFLKSYKQYKSENFLLDYEDLIFHTKNLLTNSAIKDWVLYKLDGGIMHLLVDEAQDTSAAQWDIIEAVVSEFYSGISAVNSNRTIFIVGDEKQSIYSFQGANITSFVSFHGHLLSQFAASGKEYSKIDLKQSYRSLENIVYFTNVLWNKITGRELDIKSHRGQGGSIEIWDELEHDVDKEGEMFWPISEKITESLSRSKKMAKILSSYIKSYIDSGVVLKSTKLPAKPSDFMILFRRRNIFMDDLIEELENLGLPSSGSDRVLLIDHLVVKEILSLLKHTLMPLDKLNRAELLKSSVIKISENELYKICVENLKIEPSIAQFLDHIAYQSKIMSIFNLLYYIIDIIGLRKIFNHRYGIVSNEALDSLLNSAIEFEQSRTINVQEFLYWLEKSKIYIKKNQNQDVIKIMTIHAAKGLQAPIVILADTSSLPSINGYILWHNDAPIWLGDIANSNKIYNSIKNDIIDANYQEYLRLLYVAITRAEDHLIILPSTDENQKIHTNSFYDLLLKTIKDLNPIDRHNRKIFGEDVGLNLDLFCEKVTPNKQSAIYKILDFSKFKEISYNKSQIGSVKSPLDSQIALDYGFLIHKILEDSINTNNFDFTPIHPMIKMLGSNMQQSVCDKIVRLFNLPEFKLLFSDYKLYTEITVGTQEQTRNSIGRIDLLCINATNVVIVDYKTDIKLPKFIDEVPKKYIDQLKAYKIAIENIFPNQQISTKILWTEYETFMDIIILEHSPL